MPAENRTFTAAEYLAWEAEQSEKYEWVAGEIIAMSGAKPVHNLLAQTLSRLIGNAVQGRPCFVLGSDQRVHVASTSMYAYPDITVICGQPELGADGMTLTNPTVIVEVLSDSTEAYDRGAKFAHYRRLPSLQAYVLVAQNQDRIEVFERAETDWRFRDSADGAVQVEALGLSLRVAEVYAGVEIFRAAQASSSV